MREKERKKGNKGKQCNKLRICVIDANVKRVLEKEASG